MIKGVNNCIEIDQFLHDLIIKILAEKENYESSEQKNLLLIYLLASRNETLENLVAKFQYPLSRYNLVIKENKKLMQEKYNAIKLTINPDKKFIEIDEGRKFIEQADKILSLLENKKQVTIVEKEPEKTEEADESSATEKMLLSTIGAGLLGVGATALHQFIFEDNPFGLSQKYSFFSKELSGSASLGVITGAGILGGSSYFLWRYLKDQNKKNKNSFSKIKVS